MKKEILLVIILAIIIVFLLVLVLWPNSRVLAPVNPAIQINSPKANEQVSSPIKIHKNKIIFKAKLT